LFSTKNNHFRQSIRVAGNQEIQIPSVADFADYLIYCSISPTLQGAVAPEGMLLNIIDCIFTNLLGFLCVRQALANHYMRMVVLDAQNTTALGMGPIIFTSLPSINVSGFF
jgi:hypothetical protein